MIVRLGLLIAASIAAYVVRQRKSGRSSYREEEEPSVSIWNSENEESKPEQHPDEEKEEKTFLDLEISTEEFYVEEEEEEVKRVNNIADFRSSTLLLVNEEEEEAFAGYEEFFSGEIDFPLPIDEFEVNTDPQYASNMPNNEAELQRLRNLVKELEEREVKLEGELLEYYGLKEQESDVSELQKQLKIKSLEIDMLNITINTLHAERKKLQEEVMSGMSAKKELEATRNKLKELQRQVQLEASQTKGQLTMLMQQVTALHQKEEESVKLDAEIQDKHKAMKELEVEVLELRRMNKELQHEKRELTMKLDAAESRAAALSNMTENEMVIKAREDIINLRHANEDLVKQVEGLQMNRFSEVEELVYLRWVNACLRYELRNFQTPSGKLSARDLSKSLSPRSQEKAKRLMLEYAGSERGQGDTDLESISSQPSSPGSDDFDNASVDSSSSKFSTFSKKTSLVQKLKRWGRAKDELSAMLSPSRSFGGNPSMRSSNSAKSPAMRGPLEALMLRNAGDSMAITTFGKREDEPLESLHGSSSDPLNSVTASFQMMSKSVEGVAEDKYPAYKDRHKLALEREKAVKEKADQARAGRFGYGQSFESKVKFGIPTPIVLPPKLTQLKKVSGGTNMGSEGTNTSGGVTEITDPSNDSGTETPVVSKMKLAHIEKRAPRVPRPPPRSLAGTSATDAKITSTGNGIPPPPPPPLTPGAPPPPPRPPPPPGSALKGSPGGKVHRAPELVELYQSLMKRESKNTTALPSSGSSTADVRSNMIGEIENRSTFLLAVKADVESQGDFVNSLAAEVRAASFTRIEDLLLFVNWLDEELSFLVDERAVLKHFDWPEGKADALREAAFEYQDLMKLEYQVSSFVDDPKLPCEVSLKKMYSLLEKMEQSVYALLRTRDMAISRYKEFGFPVDWLNDSGVVGKIKLASVQLARKYMKRVSTELDALGGTEKEPNREFLLLQGVRFAFRVHQFAGGFDAESMQAFEELRSRVNSGTTGADKNE